MYTHAHTHTCTHTHMHTHIYHHHNPHSFPNAEQTVRLEDLLGDTDANRERILHEADPRARWPDDIGIGLFDIATICLNQKAKERQDMDQVRMSRVGRVSIGVWIWHVIRILS